MSTPARPLLERAIVARAALDSFRKLDPRRMVRNPVMFVVMVGARSPPVLWIHARRRDKGDAQPGLRARHRAVVVVHVLFANFAEAMAEGRGKAQADALRKARRAVMAKRLASLRLDASREESHFCKAAEG
jgi:K+-transporting ATPase ATPase B chain